MKEYISHIPNETWGSKSEWCMVNTDADSNSKTAFENILIKGRKDRPTLRNAYEIQGKL